MTGPGGTFLPLALWLQQLNKSRKGPCLFNRYRGAANQRQGGGDKRAGHTGQYINSSFWKGLRKAASIILPGTGGVCLSAANVESPSCTEASAAPMHPSRHIPQTCLASFLVVLIAGMLMHDRQHEFDRLEGPAGCQARQQGKVITVPPSD